MDLDDTSLTWPSSSKTSNDETKVGGGETANAVRPWDYEQFEERLRSFDGLNWPLQETTLLHDPMTIARHGWKVCGELKLRCSSCSKVILCAEADAVCASLNALVSSGHYHSCAWWCNPSPASFATILPNPADLSPELAELPPDAQVRAMLTVRCGRLLARLPLRCVPKIDLGAHALVSSFCGQFREDLSGVFGMLPQLRELLRDSPVVLACFEPNALASFKECVLTALCMGYFAWDFAGDHPSVQGLSEQDRSLAVLCRCCQSVVLLPGFTSAMVAWSVENFSRDRSLPSGRLLFGQSLDSSDSCIDSSPGLFLLGDRKRVLSKSPTAPGPYSHPPSPVLFDPFRSHRHFCPWRRLISSIDSIDSIFIQPLA